MTATPPGEHPSRAESRQWLGIGLVVLGAAAYGLLLVLARLNYDHGTNPLTVLFVRAAGFCLLLALFLRLSGRQMALAPSERYASLGLGVFMAFQTWCNYSAITYIPVSLAVLLLYTYPLFVALGMRFTEGEPLTPMKLAALAAAFGGLTLTLQVSAGPLDPRGLGLGLMAGFGLAATVMAGNHILRRADSRRMTLHMTAASSTAYVLVIFGLDLLVLPDSAAGWALLGAMPVVYLVAMLAFFTAVPMIGPMRASMINNMEPITTILLAALLLGEALGPLQLAGAALVIGAIFVMQLATRRAARAMRRAESGEGSA